MRSATEENKFETPQMRFGYAINFRFSVWCNTGDISLLINEANALENVSTG